MLSLCGPLPPKRNKGKDPGLRHKPEVPFTHVQETLAKVWKRTPERLEKARTHCVEFIKVELIKCFLK